MADNGYVTSDLDYICQCGGLDEQVKKVYSTLRRFDKNSKREEWKQRRDVAWDAIENKILDDKDISDMADMKQVQPTINKCNKGVQGSAAIVTDQKPELKFNPIGKGDLYVAELLKRANDVVWAKSEGEDEIYRLTEESKIGGIGFINCWYDQAKGPFGRIMFEEDDPTNYYWDAESRKRDFSDSHLIKAIRRTRQYIENHYPGLKEEDLTFKAGPDDPTLSTGLTTGDNYAEGKKDPDDTEDSARPKVWEIEAWLLDTVDVFIVVKPINGKIATLVFDSMEEAEFEGGEIVKKKKEVRKKCIVVGKKLISTEINPDGTDADGDPIVDWAALPHQRTRNAYPMSPTNYAVEINKDKIKRRAQLNFAVSQLANSPIVRPKNCKWKGHPGTPGSELEVDNNAAFQPYRLGSGAANVQLFAELEALNDKDIDDQYDLSDVLRGQIDNRIAWQTVYALQEFGAMMSKPFLRALESAMVRLGRSIIAKALKYWSRDQWERLIEDREWEAWLPNDEQMEVDQLIEQAEQNGNDAVQLKRDKAQVIRNKWIEALDVVSPEQGETDLNIMDIDVKITAGSSMPTNRMAKLGAAIELTNAQIYDAQAALEYIDDPNKDEVIARRKQQEQAAMQAELQAQTQQG